MKLELTWRKMPLHSRVENIEIIGYVVVNRDLPKTKNDIKTMEFKHRISLIRLVHANNAIFGIL